MRAANNVQRAVVGPPLLKAVTTGQCFADGGSRDCFLANKFEKYFTYSGNCVK